MKKEYDFSKGVRGKFFIPPDKMNIPIYLEKNVQKYFFEKAQAQGKNPSDLINQILKKDIEIKKTGIDRFVKFNIINHIVIVHILWN